MALKQKMPVDVWLFSFVAAESILERLREAQISEVYLASEGVTLLEVTITSYSAESEVLQSK